MQTINVANVQGTPQDLTANAGEATTFMMIPQTLPADAFVKVVIETEDGFSVVFQGSIGGGSWEAGKTYTYTISASSILWEYVFEVTSLSNDAEHAGDTQKYITIFDFDGSRYSSYQVKSYRRLASNPTQTEILPWEIRNMHNVNYEVKDFDTGKMGVKDSTAVTAMPDWITLEPSTLKGDGSVDAVTYNVSVTPMKTWSSYAGDLKMQANPLKGSDDDPWDLSTHTHMGEIRARSTANCYIVHSGGTYMLPLVYGNAIEAGKENPDSWIYNYGGSTATSKEKISSFIMGNKNVPKGYKESDGTTVKVVNNRNYNFQDHEKTYNNSIWEADDDNDGITQPYISTLDGGRHTPADACLVWQDVYDAVMEGSVELYEKPDAGGGSPDDVKHFLKFTLNAEHLTQGNIVLAVRNAAGEIMWSWHIWISDYDYTATERNEILDSYGIKSKYELQDVVSDNGVAKDSGSGVVYTVAMSNLGHCVPKTKALFHRKLVLDFVQKDLNGADINIERRSVFQRGLELVGTVGNNVYYQWGRKDPIVGIWNLTEGIKQHWAWESKYKYEVKAERVHPRDAVKNPNVLYVNGDNKDTDEEYADWCSKPSIGYFNLWNNYDMDHTKSTNRNDSKKTVKTVYDPSPVGFEVPPAATYQVISSAGDDGQSLTTDKLEFNGLWRGEVPNDDSGRVYGLYTQINKGGDLLRIESTGQRSYNSTLSTMGLGGLWNVNHVYIWLADPVMNTNVYTEKLNAGSAYTLAIGPEAAFYEGRFFSPYMSAVKAMARPVRPIFDEDYVAKGGEY